VHLIFNLDGHKKEDMTTVGNDHNPSEVFYATVVIPLQWINKLNDFANMDVN
jgi:hypothetical protein